jgi:hypothetical protein
MSHHYSGPEFGFPRGDARLDLTDVYAFPKPGHADRSIFIINVHPSSTVIEPHATVAEPFSPDAMYELNLDTNGDAVADIIYRIRFSRSADGGQSATLLRATGEEVADQRCGGQSLIDEAPVSLGRDARVAQGYDHRFFAGRRSESFFFDTLGAINNLQFTGCDFFADKNVCSIVLDVSNSSLGQGPIRLWARVLVHEGEKWTQVERGARPQQAVFLPGDKKQAYLSGKPSDDEQFVSVFAHSLTHAGGYTAAEAERVARSLLPDLMYYDPLRAASYPDNGRTLIDDAADTFMAIFTNGKIAGDGVGPHADFLTEFPYLGPPHGT